jgi:AcrR family transcriptional regulator
VSVAKTDPRTRDAARTKAELIAAAIEVFAEAGFFGARVDEIAARTQTTKRMIYYYFGDKQGLFAAVLQEVYAGIRQSEEALDLGHLPPLDALAVLIKHTFNYHDERPYLARLFQAENSQEAVHLLADPNQPARNRPIIAIIEDILERGHRDGTIVRKVDAIELHLMIVSVALYRITNASTVLATFGMDMSTAAFKDQQIRDLTEMLGLWLAMPRETDLGPRA